MSNTTPWSHARALSSLVILYLFSIDAPKAWDLTTGSRQVVERRATEAAADEVIDVRMEYVGRQLEATTHPRDWCREVQPARTGSAWLLYWMRVYG
jgi:hypothetical protein